MKAHLVIPKQSRECRNAKKRFKNLTNNHKKWQNHLKQAKELQDEWLKNNSPTRIDASA